MKRIQILIMLFIICLMLTACDPGTYNYEYDDLRDNVVSIELIKYDNPNQKHFTSWVPDHSSQLVPLNLANMTILETLNNEDIPAFLHQLSKVDFLDKYYAFDSPKDMCIRMMYANGDFEIISCDYINQSYCGYVGRYTSSGEVVSYVGSFTNLAEFERLVNNYFETELVQSK